MLYNRIQSTSDIWVKWCDVIPNSRSLCSIVRQLQVNNDAMSPTQKPLSTRKISCSSIICSRVRPLCMSGVLEMVICQSSSLTNCKASGVKLSSRIAYCNACEHSSNSSSNRSLDTGWPTLVTTACNNQVHCSLRKFLEVSFKRHGWANYILEIQMTILERGWEHFPDPKNVPDNSLGIDLGIWGSISGLILGSGNILQNASMRSRDCTSIP